MKERVCVCGRVVEQKSNRVIRDMKREWERRERKRERAKGRAHKKVLCC